MPTKFIRAMDREIEDLERELRADPRYVKLQELRRIRDLYMTEARVEQATAPAVPDEFPNLTRRRIARERVRKAAAEIIRGRTLPTPTSSILAEIRGQGIEVPGKDPRNSLSAMLSHAPEFVSHGRAGWTLVEQQSAQENEEAADANPSNGASAASERSRFDQPGNPAPLLSANPERG